MSDNLPLVMKAGGEVAEVLSWDQHKNIPDVAKNAIARFVINNPEYSKDIDLMADLVSFHGLAFDIDIRRFIAEYGPDVVHLANQYLYDTARQSRTEHTFEFIEDAIQALANLREAGLQLGSVEYIDQLIEKLGGFERVSMMDADDINNRLNR